MKNKYYLLLKRFTNLLIKKEDIEDYLEQCKKLDEKPSASDFLDFIGNEYIFDSFNEEIEDTEIEDSSQFYKLIKEINND